MREISFGREQKLCQRRRSSRVNNLCKLGMQCELEQEAKSNHFTSCSFVWQLKVFIDEQLHVVMHAGSEFRSYLKQAFTFLINKGKRLSIIFQARHRYINNSKAWNSLV